MHDSDLWMISSGRYDGWLIQWDEDMVRFKSYETRVNSRGKAVRGVLLFTSGQ